MLPSELDTPINVLTATTVTVRAGKGYLFHLFAVGGTMGDVTLYDGLNDSAPVLFGPATPVAGGVVAAGIPFKTGLTIKTAAATKLQGACR